MIHAILGSLLAALLSLGFAAVGEALLGRRSRDLPSWNESFLIGSGACAAFLFPLTLLARSHALTLEMVIIAIAVGAVLWRRLRRRGRTADPAPSAPWDGDLSAMAEDPVSVVLLAAIVAIAIFFGVLNIRAGQGWDGAQVWATKGQLIAVNGGLTREWFPEEGYDVRLVAYPPYISFFEAAFSRLRGGFDFDRLKPIFFGLYVSLLLGTYSAARTICSRRWALAAALLVALLPELSTATSADGCVDMPLAAFVAAIVAASLREGSRRPGVGSPLPWLIGALTTVKQEGMVLVLVACVAIGLSWILERPRRLAERLRENGAGAALIAAFVALRVGYVRWTGVHDITWGPFDAEHRLRALHSVRLVASLCLRLLLSPEEWGLFWPAFFVASALVVAWRQARPSLVALAVVGAIGIESPVFLFTNWDMAVHIIGAYTRLLAQLAPAAAVVMCTAAERLWRPSIPGTAA